MSVPVVAFFNNKGGVGKTSLVYHLAWMYAELGVRVVAADLDPQGNLSAAFLDDDRLEALWDQGALDPKTIYGAVQPLKRGVGDVATPFLETIDEKLGLLVGDLGLSDFEDQLSEVWPKCMDRDERAFRVTSAFWRILQTAAQAQRADLILVDMGPNLGAINRAALIAADFVAIPLSPDLFSLQGLRNLGPTLRRWRDEWRERREKNPAADLDLPAGQIQPIGYIVMQHSVRLDRPVKAYDRWIARIPQMYSQKVLDEAGDPNVSVKDDPHCLALLKHYRSLMPLAQEAHKPMFQLKPADGAIGAHVSAVHGVRQDFQALAKIIAQRVGISLPPSAFAFA
jgi:chromosome partitioning protein